MLITCSPRVFVYIFAGKYEADPQGDPEGDGDQLNPSSASGHCHVHDDGPTTVRHQLRKLQKHFETFFWIVQNVHTVGI